MLESILSRLDRLYDLGLDLDIRDYVISRDTCARLGADMGHGSVLVRENASGGEIQLGLYLGEEELRRLSDLDLTNELSAEGFELLVTAIEEVSHFAYLVFSAERRKRVTQLELELQGEVDKYVTSLIMLASRDGGCAPRALLDRLFGDFEVRGGLPRDRRIRYEQASSLASRYCSYVLGAARSSTSLRALLPELRRFYRLTQSGKIGRIHRVVYQA